MMCDLAMWVQTGWPCHKGVYIFLFLWGGGGEGWGMCRSEKGSSIGPGHTDWTINITYIIYL